MISILLLAGLKLPPPFLYPNLSRPFDHWPVIVAAFIGLYAISVAIIRIQFLSVRRVIRRGLIFAISAAIIVALFSLAYADSPTL